MTPSEQELSAMIKSYANQIYGLFLGNDFGVVYKEMVFNEEYCPLSILTNIINALCSFISETNISDYATIQLSKAKVSFKKYKSAVLIVVHNIPENSAVFSMLEKFAIILEKKARQKFYSSDDAQVFSGMLSTFKDVAEKYFQYVKKVQSELAEKETKKEDQEIEKTEKEAPTQKILKVKKEGFTGNEQEHIKQLLTTLQMSFKGILHMVIVEHDNNTAEVFFEHGNLAKKYVEASMKIINKFLPHIIELMQDTSEENILEVSEKHKIVFTVMDGDHFLYIIADKDADLILLQPVFRRIAKKINEIIHEKT